MPRLITLDYSCATPKLECADQIQDKTRELVRQRYDNWFGKFKLEERPFVGLALIGYAKGADGAWTARTYLLASATDFAPQLFPTGCCLMGVPQYAIYLMHRLYNPQMKVVHLTQLAAYLISETATQDPKVGGPIRIATIKERAGFRELTTKEIDNIVAQNAKQSIKLRRFFFKG